MSCRRKAGEQDARVYIPHAPVVSRGVSGHSSVVGPSCHFHRRSLWVMNTAAASVIVCMLYCEQVRRQRYSLRQNYVHIATGFLLNQVFEIQCVSYYPNMQKSHRRRRLYLPNYSVLTWFGTICIKMPNSEMNRCLKSWTGRLQPWVLEAVPQSMFGILESLTHFIIKPNA